MTREWPPSVAICHAHRGCIREGTSSSAACTAGNGSNSDHSSGCRMADTAAALGSLGSDLAFSVSFGIGNELLEAAREAQMSEDELIASVLVLSIVFAALPRTLRITLSELRSWRCMKVLAFDKDSGLAAFATLLVDIARRIAISLSVQLLAANVRAKQPNRAVRVVSLLSVAIFFLFLEASSSIGLKVHRP